MPEGKREGFFGGAVEKMESAEPTRWSDDVKAYCARVYEDGVWSGVAPTVVDMPEGWAESVKREVETEVREGRVAWTTDRHENYPTPDVPVTPSTLPLASKVARALLADHVGPAFAERYTGVRREALSLQEAFVVRYTDDGQDRLEEHVDGAPLSFVCALNDDFEGGGTRFSELQTECRPRKGQCCVFSGGTQPHEGLPASGERWILAGFVNHGPTAAECARVVEHL